MAGVHLGEEHDAHFWQHGYVVVENFLTTHELEAAVYNFLHYFPSAEEFARYPSRFDWLRSGPFAGHREGPFTGDALNDLATHEEIVFFAERAIGTRELMLTQNNVWAKYARATDYEQALHLDYRNHTLTVPSDDPRYQQVEVFIYLTDVKVDLGPTYVVSWEHTRHLPVEPATRTREDDPALYEREVPVVVPAGSLLAYTPSTWHRGSAIRAASGARFIHGFAYRAAGFQWMGYRSWPFHGGRPEMDWFIERATPRQRELLGFPPAGHEFWNRETLAALALRYPTMDITPYLRND